MITKKDLIKEIKRQNKEMEKGKRAKGHFSFLGFVENKDLSEEVINYFCFKNEYGIIRGYDWVNGNDKLKELIKEVLK